jgi:predicted kinase
MAGRLHFTIGLPRSGKTTYCKQWADQDKGRVVVNADSIRLALSGDRYNSLCEPQVHATKLVMVRSLLLYGYDVMVDGTHTTKRSILELLYIDPMERFGIDEDVYPHVLETHPDVCVQRARETGQNDLIPVIDRMVNNLNEWVTNLFITDNDGHKRLYGLGIIDDIHKKIFSSFPNKTFIRRA